MQGLIAVVVLLMVAVGVVAARAPVQRRLALRNVARRKNEAALVIAGSLLGTALITGSFIVGDTLDSSIRATAATQLGPIDELVAVPEPAEAASLADDLAALDDPRIDGVTTLLGVPGSVITGSGDDVKAEPEAQVIEIDFEAGRAFGNDPATTGISGSTPGDGEVAITEDLSASIAASTGDEVTLFLYGDELQLEVVRILPRRGIAGFWLGFESTSPNAFVAPGTIEGMTADKLPPGALPPTTAVIVSNRGDVEAGAALTGQVTDVIEETIGGSSLRVEPLKKDRLDSAEQQGAEFSELFLGIGTFAIVAGVLLLINIFVMLAQERKSQLGMLRAVGLRRSDLVRVFVIEGFMYSVAAGLLGAVLGIGVGWAIAKLAAPIFGGADEFALELHFSMSPESIILGFCLGIVITALTIFLTSLRISRVNIIRAIRDLPEPTHRTVRRRALIVGGIVAAAALGAFFTSLGNVEAWAGALLGPPVAAYSLLPIISQWVRRKVAVMIVAGFSLLWGIFGNTLLNNQFFESGEIFAFVMQGVLLTFSAVIMLSQTADTFEAVIRRIAARNLPLRLGLAYPVARRFRTGLTLGMYALVIFTMTFIAVLASVFGGQVDDTVRRSAGGFDIVATASGTNPPSSEKLLDADGVESLSTLVTGNALFQPPGVPVPEPWPVSGIEPDFVETGPPALEERDEQKFDSDRAVWEAIVDDPGLVIIPEFFLEEGGGPPGEIVSPGETMKVFDPLTGESVERTIAGVVSFDATFSGVYMSRESVVDVLGPRATASRFFLTIEEGASGPDVAASLQGSFYRNGVEADTFRALVEEFQTLNLQFFRLMQGYLHSVFLSASRDSAS